MNRTPLLAAAALALSACTPDFAPASMMDKLRLLAIQAEPPEIEPADVGTAAPDRATLTSLVLRADLDAESARTTTVVHLACVPVPGSPAPLPCVMLATLRDPAAAIAAGAQQACSAGAGADSGAPWPAIELAGLEVCVGATCGPAVVGGMPLPPAQVAVPSGFAFPLQGPERILGVQAVVLAFALEATPDELVAGVGTSCPAGDVAANLARLWPAREHVLSTKRVQIRGPDAPDEPNRNPKLDGIRAGSTDLLDPGIVTTLVSGEISLTAVPVGEPELYTKLDAAGVPIESAREEWVYSWFSTAGELDALHTRGGEADAWTVAAGAPGTRAVVVAVVRDLRGGTAWAVRDVTIAP